MTTILLFIFLTIFSYVTWGILYKIVRLLRRIKKTLINIESLLMPEKASVIEFYTTINGQKEKVEHMFLKVTQNLPLSIEVKDKAGNPAKVDGVPAWAITDLALGTLEVAADGMSALLKPVGPLGNFKVQVKADADLGEGVKEIMGELDIDLVAGEAVTVELKAGEPVDA